MREYYEKKNLTVLLYAPLVLADKLGTERIKILLHIQIKNV